MSWAADTNGYIFDIDACNHLTSKTGLKLGMSKTEALEIFKKYEGYDNITVNTNDLGGFSMTYRHISDGKNYYSIMIEVNFAHASDEEDSKIVNFSIIRTDF
jgi:hypothetical protein